MGWAGGGEQVIPCRQRDVMKGIVACHNFVNMPKNLLPLPGTETCFLSLPAHSVDTQNFISWCYSIELCKNFPYVRLICMICSVIVECCSKHVSEICL